MQKCHLVNTVLLSWRPPVLCFNMTHIALLCDAFSSAQLTASWHPAFHAQGGRMPQSYLRVLMVVDMEHTTALQSVSQGSVVQLPI